MIDFTTTAMPRPDILDRCYSSFQENLIDLNLKDCDCYINIDPFPYENEKQLKQIKRLISGTIGVAKKFFKNVVSRYPKKPNYAAAYKWLWNEAKSEIIFNLEDDWELLRPIKVSRMLEEFDRTKSLYQVVLRAYNYVYPTCCTSPSFLHQRWHKPISKGLNTYENPESQIHKNHNGKFNVFVPNKKTCDSNKHPGEKRVIENYVVAYPKYRKVNGNIIVQDIGKKWIEKSPYISPVELIKYEKTMYKRHQNKMDNRQRKYMLKYIESLKKVNFLSWVIRPGVNPLRWLMDYKWQQ